MPLFQSMVVFEPAGLQQQLEAAGGDWRTRRVESCSQTNLPITLIAYGETRLRLQIQFDRLQFDKPTITRMLGHLARLLDAMAEKPGCHLRELPMLGEDERRQLLVDWNDTTVDFPRDKTIHELFEQQVQRTPDQVAVEQGDASLTYRQLDERAGQLARFLIGQGAGPDVIVAMYIGRSVEVAVSLLGILKANAAFLPLDPAYASPRISHMLESSRDPILITQAALVDQLPKTSGQVVCIDDDWQRIESAAGPSRAAHAKPDDLMYVMFTSGSTGRPKGVQITNRNVVNYVSDYLARTKLGREDRVGGISALSFDIAVEEIFPTLLSGATLVFRDEDTIKAPLILVLP